ncbi:hypothetical protein Bca101_055598 [Brassica carinata]
MSRSDMLSDLRHGLYLVRSVRVNLHSEGAWLVYFSNSGDLLLGDVSLRKRVMRGLVQTKMADLSDQGRVVASGSFNLAVIYGSCGLSDSSPSCLLFSSFGSHSALSTQELAQFGLVSPLWFSKGALGESVLGMVDFLAVWESFQMMCNVVYKPGSLGVSTGNTPLFFIECLVDCDGYKLCGVHRKLATLEATREISASKKMRRTSLSRDHRDREECVSSVMEKFRDLNLDDTLESVGEDDDDGVIVTLLHQVKDLEKKLKEWKAWALKKAMQVAQKVNDELAELKNGIVKEKKLKLHDAIIAEKEKVLPQITQDEKENEAKREQEQGQEQKVKEPTLAQVEEEKRSKQAAEAHNKRKLEILRLKIELEFQQQKDDHQT